VSATAIKRVVARQVEAAMLQKGLSKAEMARRMRTSRAALNRLLDPENAAVTLSTLQKAAAVVGRELRLELV
jgi:antitoxin HicB